MKEENEPSVGRCRARVVQEGAPQVPRPLGGKDLGRFEGLYGQWLAHPEQEGQ